MIEAYPLHWPANKPRTPKSARKKAMFGKAGREHSTTIPGHSWHIKNQLSVAEAVNRLLSELDKYTRINHTIRVPESSIIISSNLPTRDGHVPYSDKKQPDDCGVAVYFKLDGKDYCLPCDKWDRVADNIAAVAAHVSAMRGIERWGVGELHDVYTGFKALPEHTEGIAWWNILQCRKDASEVEIKTAYRELAKKFHPDCPTGDSEKFIQVQRAYEFAINQS